MPSFDNPIDSFYVNYHDTVFLHIYELPTIEAFISGNDTICDNDLSQAEIKISFTGIPPFNFEYKKNGIPQGSIITDINPYIIYTRESGSYELESFSDALEVGSVSGQAFVTLSVSPIAKFHLAESDTLTILNTAASFIDESIGTIDSWTWDFGDGSFFEYIQNPIHVYDTLPAIYQASLVVSNTHNCLDTFSRNIVVKDHYWIYIPNSFTPDEDQLNDKFCISYNGIRDDDFSFRIYDKFSSEVYSTNNILDLHCQNGWDGVNQNTGNLLLHGTYIYEISYKDFEGWKHQEFGVIFIVR